MDIFRFLNPDDPTKFEQGEIINGLKSKMWIERYRDGGEFTIIGYTDDNAMEKLPIGSFISHLETAEVMIVENHEINDQKGKRTEVKITGRGFDTYLEQRVVGANKNPLTVTPNKYTLSADYTWNQAVTLISDHILASELINDDDALNHVAVMTNVPGVGISELRELKTGELYSELISLLATDDLGIKIYRPGPTSPLGASDTNLVILIHKGYDRSGEVVFSYNTGEVESADYLWSNKALKNAALVTGKWVETMVIPPTATNYDRRWMAVSASDIDESFNAMPTGGDLTTVLTKMLQRGNQALAAQSFTNLTKAEVSKEAVQAKYRIDYDVGDIITVVGDYNATASMRVSEYVEMEDETGISAYPTLAMIE